MISDYQGAHEDRALLRYHRDAHFLFNIMGHNSVGGSKINSNIHIFHI